MSSNVGSTISRDTEFQSASCLFFRVVLNSVVISAPIEWHKTTGFSPISSRGLRAFYISRSHLPDEIRSYIIVSESLESSHQLISFIVSWSEVLGDLFLSYL